MIQWRTPVGAWATKTRRYIMLDCGHTEERVRDDRIAECLSCAECRREVEEGQVIEA